MTNEFEILVHLLLCHLDIFLDTMCILYVKSLFSYFYLGWFVSLLLSFEFFLLCICRCCLTPTLQIFSHISLHSLKIELSLLIYTRFYNSHHCLWWILHPALTMYLPILLCLSSTSFTSLYFIVDACFGKV